MSIPVETSSFVGRTEELAGLIERLSKARIVTLTGIGGIGKTRIALRAAAELQSRFAAGVRLVQLGGVADGSLVPNVAAVALGLGTRRGSWTPDTLSRRLERTEALLVFDGCERVSEAVAAVVDSIVFRCQSIVVLTTSRQPLRLAYEIRFPIEPLPVPSEGTSTTKPAGQSAAVQLLLDRAQAVAPGFALDDSNVAAVCTLCRRLDGIPLAIELVATRLVAMGIEDVLALLDEQPVLAIDRGELTSGRALETAIRWSYGQLTEAEQALWRRLCIFPGSFDLSAAQHVSGEMSQEDFDAQMQRVVESSMVRRLPDVLRARFAILETLRSFGLAELRAEGELDGASRRLLDWAKGVARGLESSAARSAWVARVETDIANIRAALDFASSSDEYAADGVEICTDIWTYWRVRGPVEEGRRRIDQLIDRADISDALRAKALWVSGALAVIQNDHQRGPALLEESRVLAMRIGDRGSLAWSAYYLALAAYFTSNLDTASELLNEASELHASTGDRFGTAIATTLRGQVELARDRHADATRDLEQALTLIRALGDHWVEAYVLWLLGLIVSKQGDQPAAERLIEQALLLNRETQDLTALVLCAEGLAWTAALRGDAARAARLLGGARRAWRSLSAQIEGPLRAEHDEAVALARARLGPDRYLVLEQEGFERGLGDDLLDLGEHSRASTLSLRELEVARMVASGLSNREIAGSLKLSKRTVDSHLDHIFAKVGVHGRVALANWVREADRPARPGASQG